MSGLAWWQQALVVALGGALGSVGRFAVSNLLPGRRYLVETYGLNGTVDRAFEFTVPADTTGLVDLGTVKSGSFK